MGIMLRAEYVSCNCGVALQDDTDGPATASGSRRDLKLRRPATETRC
jgi:hypothetical protein